MDDASRAFRSAALAGSGMMFAAAMLAGASMRSPPVRAKAKKPNPAKLKRNAKHKAQRVARKKNRSAK